jgi:rhodanese-related sulfurtransferase
MVMTITPHRAADLFAERLALHTDPSDVYAAMRTPSPGFVLVDARSAEAWDQGRIPGAVHLPHTEIPARAAGLLDPAVPVVTYCWGPGCNGATRAALALSLAGYRVREMLGGVEYWIREGFPVSIDAGDVRRAADDLTTVCGC